MSLRTRLCTAILDQKGTFHKLLPHEWDAHNSLKCLYSAYNNSAYHGKHLNSNIWRGVHILLAMWYSHALFDRWNILKGCELIFEFTLHLMLLRSINRHKYLKETLQKMHGPQISSGPSGEIDSYQKGKSVPVKKKTDNEYLLYSWLLHFRVWHLYTSVENPRHSSSVQEIWDPYYSQDLAGRAAASPPHQHHRWKTGKR